MYSLMWGEDGVDRLLEIFTEEVSTNMQLLGVKNLSELEPRHVRRPASASRSLADAHGTQLNTKRLDPLIIDDFRDPRSVLDRVRAKL